MFLKILFEVINVMQHFQIRRPSQQSAAAVGEKLKQDLQTLRRKYATPLTSKPMSDESDNADTDLFENTEQRRVRKRAVGNILIFSVGLKAVYIY